MTVRLLGAAGAVAFAMTLEPTSFRLADPEANLPGGSIKGATPSSLAADVERGGAAVLPQATSATLSMVPASPKLVKRLSSLLPKTTSVREAALGFHDQAQFVATVQVSHNLAIPFPLLKDKVVGQGLSLGQAIREIKPTANVSRELARARELSAP